MSYCILFAGQSAQRRGMCAELWRDPVARAILERLAPSLGDDLEYLTTEMPEDELALTFHAQRALHAHHLGHYFALRAREGELRLDGAVGHSVGVAAALVAAGAMSVEDSGRLVRERARLFAAVCASLAGGAGLVSASSPHFAELVAEVDRFPGVSLALRNTLTRGVLGGSLAALDALRKKARDEEWPVRLTPLAVEGPFHTAAFAPAQAPLRALLDELPIQTPSVPVFMGTSGRGERDPARIRDLLVAQLTGCEQHLDAVRAAYHHGCRAFLESAFQPQPIRWLPDQLTDDGEALWPGVVAREISNP